MSEFEALRYRNKLGLRNRLGRAIWGGCYTVLVRPTPRWAMHGWRRSILRLFGAQIGKGCKIDPSARIWAPWNLVLGDYVSIDGGCDIYNVARICVGSKVAISKQSFLCTASHDISSLHRPLTHAPITIGNHAWIAANAMIFPGVTVGEGAVIAARAVLRQDAPAWSIWAGNPALRVGTRILHDRVSHGENPVLFNDRKKHALRTL